MRASERFSQSVRVVGVLDVIHHSTRQFILRVAGAPLRGIAHDISSLKEMWGQRVTVTGTASFRPSGTILNIEAVDIRVANEQDEALFSSPPMPLLGTDRLARTIGGSFCDAIGKWPGDENDDELHDLLVKFS